MLIGLHMKEISPSFNPAQPLLSPAVEGDNRNPADAAHKQHQLEEEKQEI